jgi:hypothetical protein
VGEADGASLEERQSERVDAVEEQLATEFCFTHLFIRSGGQPPVSGLTALSLY